MFWSFERKLWLCFSYRYILITVFLLLKNIFHIYFREKMAQAYDFALDKIGMEIMSYQVELKFSNTYT